MPSRPRCSTFGSQSAALLSRNETLNRREKSFKISVKVAGPKQKDGHDSPHFVIHAVANTIGFGIRPVMSARDVTDEDREIGERLLACRLARKISQGDLASCIGVTAQQVRKYENGSNRISVVKLQKAAELLQVDLADLGTSGKVVPLRWGSSRNSQHLAELMQLWDKLPVNVQAAIFALVKAIA